MDPSYDHNLLARILLTLMTAGYGLATVKADFNRTHATNPLWTPHARFHVVWQVLSYTGIAVIALCLIWLNGPLPKERLLLAGALGAAVYGAFSPRYLYESCLAAHSMIKMATRPFDPR